GEAEPYRRVAHTLGSCSPIPGAEVYRYPTEKSLLRAWKDFVIQTDPDLITGREITRFDIPYLLFRAKYIGVADFPTLGRF
ncbi:ribonuclease H-like domain-containing protein, partial [Mycena filopes]